MSRMKELTMHQGIPKGQREYPVDEDILRRDLAAAYRMCALNGWEDLVANHLTVRLPQEEGKPESFLINPFGMMFEEITASSLVKIDVEGNLVDGDDTPINKAGFVVHSAIHRTRPDAACVMHVHTDDGVAVSALAEGLLPLNQTAMIIRSKVAFHDYEGPAVGEAERERMANHLGNKHMMILRNHGTMTLGSSVAEAYHRLHMLEHACTWQVRTLSMGRQLRYADQAVIDDTDLNWGHADTAYAAYARNIVWPAILRKLDRTYPDYRD